MLVLAAGGTSSLALLGLAVIVVINYYVFPKIALPAFLRWLERRRGKEPRHEARPGWLAPTIAGMVVVAVIIRAWDSDLGRPALGALLAGCLGVVIGMWHLSRNRE